MTEQRESRTEPWRRIDETLAQAESEFDFISHVSPTNVDEAWERFDESGRQKAPTLESPPLEVDVGLLRSRIDDLPFGEVEDLDIRFILAGKQEELRWQLEMLEARDTPDFLIRSMLHYGPVSEELLRTARTILSEVPPQKGGGESVAEDEVHRRADEELETYRRRDPSFDAELDIEDDQEGLQASHGDLLVPDDLKLAPQRLEALVQHEVGVHLVTHHNGEQQPLQVLRNGLADYDEVQEAFGVLAEFFADGLTSTRLRLLASRTVAVHSLEDGADFVETFRLLTGEVGLGAEIAFDMTARIHACGGLTRDQIYLRGLVWLLRYLSSEGDLEPLYIGKLGLHQVASIIRLRRRGFLAEPPLRPAFLEVDSGREKLARLRKGLTPAELVADR